MAGKTSTDGLSQEEREAVKERAKELRAWRQALVARDERRVRWTLDVDPIEV